MSKQQEALRLALEALELAQDNLRDHGDNCFLHDEGEYNRCFCGKDSLSNHLQSVVEKLDEALNAPLAEQPAQQEPVAYLCENAVGHKYFRWKKPSSTYKPIALYTFPPAQRPWVGLTDEEVEEVWKRVEASDFRDVVQPFARAIEVALRSRNENNN